MPVLVAGMKSLALGAEIVHDNNDYNFRLLTRSLFTAVPLLCIVILGGESLPAIGFKRPALQDLGIVCVCWLLRFSVGHIVRITLARIVESDRSEWHTGGSYNWFLFLAAQAANATCEELAVWGLLYTRLRRLMHREELGPIVIASFCFASYHVYQGVQSAIVIFIASALAHGAMFRLTGRLWPLIVSHFLWNLVWAS
jgi:membrane protease YdiL (CAAX protease family)